MWKVPNKKRIFFSRRTEKTEFNTGWTCGKWKGFLYQNAPTEVTHKTTLYSVMCECTRHVAWTGGLFISGLSGSFKKSVIIGWMRQNPLFQAKQQLFLQQQHLCTLIDRQIEFVKAELGQMPSKRNYSRLLARSYKRRCSTTTCWRLRHSSSSSSCKSRRKWLLRSFSKLCGFFGIHSTVLSRRRQWTRGRRGQKYSRRLPLWWRNFPHCPNEVRANCTHMDVEPDVLKIA